MQPVRDAVGACGCMNGSASTMSIVTNCRVLGEGVDLPAVDLVVFVDPKQSHRHPAVHGPRPRLSRGKELGYILVPTGEAAATRGRSR